MGAVIVCRGFEGEGIEMERVHGSKFRVKE